MPSPTKKITDRGDSYKKVLIIWMICFGLFLLFLWVGPGILRSLSWTQPENSLLLGERYLKEGKIDKAHDKLIDAVRLYPNDTHAHYLLGDASEKLNQKQQAVQEYETSLDLDGNNPQADAQLVKLYTTQGRTKDAAIYSDKINFQSGQNLLKTKEYQKAMEHYTKINPDSPFYAIARTEYALCQSGLGNTNPAMKELQKVITTEPNQEEALRTLTELYTSKKMDTQAKETHRLLQALTPTISVNQNLAKRVLFLGYEIRSGELKPGQSFDITYYWKCLLPFKEKYTVGVQFYDSKGNIPFVNWHDPVNGTHPTSDWKVGEVIKEKYTVLIPTNAPVDTYSIVIQMCLPDGTHPIGRGDITSSGFGAGKFIAGELKTVGNE